MNVKHLDALESVSTRLAQLQELQAAMVISCKSLANPERALENLSDQTSKIKSDLDAVIKENQTPLTN